jgi:hypothetical protein
MPSSRGNAPFRGSFAARALCLSLYLVFTSLASGVSAQQQADTSSQADSPQQEHDHSEAITLVARQNSKRMKESLLRAKANAFH